MSSLAVIFTRIYDYLLGGNKVHSFEISSAKIRTIDEVSRLQVVQIRDKPLLEPNWLRQCCFEVMTG